ncbi:hypothetical protein [Sporosarcina sp. E16_3]|nr:hypothetical protein [Sporosarcina sp. E16_3]
MSKLGEVIGTLIVVAVGSMIVLSSASITWLFLTWAFGGGR